ncbi:MAG TPA: hypothetical protein VGW74_06870 [Propionibacteriaceae bacterium]|nr:hypothetical protein [Propionibacteriaceae bacterium]
MKASTTVRVTSVSASDHGLRYASGWTTNVAVTATSERGDELTLVVGSHEAPSVGMQLRVTIEALPTDDDATLTAKRMEAAARGEQYQWPDTAEATS